MKDKILVAYATKHGATAEIAEKIGQVLKDVDLPTDVQNVKQVDDLTPYTAVILGSAVYIGNWQKEAARFLQGNELALAERQVWLFSSGPTGEGDPVELQNGWIFPSKLQPIADRIKPRGIAVFHGAVDPDDLNFLTRWMMNNVKAPLGDFRDWDAIEDWATEIATSLTSN
ncbi:MAG: flavodoxin domain-containing protein [Caldilineales bacterium]|nr:flavodoxin domain-containing protein [Caldilineales bacterium]